MVFFIIGLTNIATTTSTMGCAPSSGSRVSVQPQVIAAEQNNNHRISMDNTNYNKTTESTREKPVIYFFFYYYYKSKVCMEIYNLFTMHCLQWRQRSCDAWPEMVKCSTPMQMSRAIYLVPCSCCWFICNFRLIFCLYFFKYLSQKY